MSHPLDLLATVEDVERFIIELYGSELPVVGGVVHVASVWPAADGELRVLRISPATPSSRVDDFVLALTRARAEAIVTTGRILRQEPRLRHELIVGGSAEADGERPGQSNLLHDWRRRRGLDQPPLLAVLTSGRDLELSHPAFSAWARPLLFTGAAAADDLRRRMPASGEDIEAIGVEQPSLRRLLRYLMDERGCRTVSVEAGPSTAAELYRPPLEVDELLLSLYRGPRPDEEILGGALPSLSVLDPLFPGHGTERMVAEASGTWGFRRYVAGGRVTRLRRARVATD